MEAANEKVAYQAIKEPSILAEQSVETIKQRVTGLIR